MRRGKRILNPEILNLKVMTQRDMSANVKKSVHLLIGLLTFFFVLFIPSIAGRADTIDLSVTYGYQNTAKAGRFLPLSIYIENTSEKTFSGYIHVYMVESEDSVYEYQYQKTVEGESEDTLSVTVSLSSGVNQILVTAEDVSGNLLGSRRVGLDVAASDAELIIGTISQSPEALSYLSGVGINNGILRTRTVSLDSDNLPQDRTALDQLDVLLITDYPLQLMKENDARTILEWVRSGGVLVLGTGARGNQALSPYFVGYLKDNLEPVAMRVQMINDYQNSNKPAFLNLTASSVVLNGGREVMFSSGVPVLSTVTEGAGIIAVCGYDFCDIQRFATDQFFYVDQLFTAIFGQSRLDKLSVAASERSLKLYWDIQSLMNMSDIHKIPEPMFYVSILMAYVLLVGPGLYFYLRTHEMIRMYRPCVLVITVLASLLVWIMGVGTRFTGPFLTYAKIKEVSEDSINETDYINLRSPYNHPYTFDVKSEYSVYPVLKGSDYNGDIQEIAVDAEAGHTTISNNRDKNEIKIQNTDPFTARYFEVKTKTPNASGSFSTDMTCTNGLLAGTLNNTSEYSLTDAAILMYGKIILIGRLEAGDSIDLAGKDIINAPVGDSQRIAELITDGTYLGLLKHYIANNMTGYYGDAKLVGFVRQEEMDSTLGFTDQTDYESYGATMIVASLPVNTKVGDEYSFSAMSTDPEVESGDYNVSDNTISGITPTILAYHLGESNNISSIAVESLSADDSWTQDRIGNVRPFRGTLSLYNNLTGGFDVVDVSDGLLDRTELNYYLSSDNVLVVKYTPGEQNIGIDERRYLPMLTVTVKENVAVINQILDSDLEEPETDDGSDSGPSPVDAAGSVIAVETAPVFTGDRQNTVLVPTDGTNAAESNINSSTSGTADTTGNGVDTDSRNSETDSTDAATSTFESGAESVGNSTT